MFYKRGLTFSLDDRLLMKQVSRFELDAFLGFAPAYFQYMSEAFFREVSGFWTCRASPSMVITIVLLLL